MPFLESSFGQQNHFKWFDNVIFSLDVVLLPAAKAVGSVPKAKTIQHDLAHSTSWFQYEKGLISESRCISALVHELQIPKEAVLDAMSKVSRREISRDIVDLAYDLQDSYGVYVAGNSPYRRCHLLEESLTPAFREEFVSCDLGARLPHPGFFRRIFAKEPSLRRRSLFVTTNADTVISARSSGLYAILVSDSNEAVSRITSLCRNPIPSTLSYLSSNAGQHHLTTNLGYTIHDTFASFILLDATRDDSHVYYNKNTQEFKWLHEGKVPFGLPDFPPDIDTNSVGHMVATNSTPEGRQAIMDKMLQFRDDDGLLLGYMDPAKIRLDPAMCVNALTFFHSQGRGADIIETQEWIEAVLRTRAFRDGTHYYPGPDLFLYFVSRLLKLENLPRATRNIFTPLLKECVLERMGLEGDALALGFRVVAAARCGVMANTDLERLMGLQEADGSWGEGVIYRFVRYKGLAFHRGITAAIALLAMREWSRVRPLLEH